jgi:hypothetical protein
MSQRRTSEEMFPLIESWESSGLTQEKFCRLHGLNLGLFGYWRKKYQQQFKQVPTDTGFVPIKVSQPVSPVLELRIGDVQLHFHELPSVDWLQELIG